LEDFIFHEGSLPSGYRFGFEPAVFHQPAHRKLQAATGWTTFHAFSRTRDEVVATVAFHVDNGTASCCVKSPFGTADFVDDLAPKVLYDFLVYAEDQLRAAGATRIVMKNYPLAYHYGKGSLLTTFLLNLGYTVSDAEAGAVIDVLPEELEERMHPWEKRKLRKAQQSGIQFREMPLDNVGEIYLFILGCRKQKGHSLSMTLPELKETLQAFPKHFALFGAFQFDVMVAASIAIHVNDRILYNFYSAHQQEFDSFSPAVFLIANIYKYCRTNEIALLDLGTSAWEGKPNFSLLDFKLHLGAQPTTKLTFEKQLS